LFLFICQGYLPDATNFNIAQIGALLVTSAELEVASQKDSILCKILYYTTTKWPNAINPYWNRCFELSVEGNTLLCRVRAVLLALLSAGYVGSSSRPPRGSMHEGTGSSHGKGYM